MKILWRYLKTWFESSSVRGFYMGKVDEEFFEYENEQSNIETLLDNSEISDSSIIFVDKDSYL